MIYESRIRKRNIEMMMRLILLEKETEKKFLRSLTKFIMIFYCYILIIDCNRLNKKLKEEGRRIKLKVIKNGFLKLKFPDFSS